MAKAKILIEIEIEYDELQYEDDGFIGIKNVIENFENEFKNKTHHQIGFDFEFLIINSQINGELTNNSDIKDNE